MADAQHLAAKYSPFYRYPSRNHRREHLALDLPEIRMRERTHIAWEGAVADYKANGMCRTSDEALCIVVAALVRRAEGHASSPLPQGFPDAYEEAGRNGKAADQSAPENNAAPKPKAARVARVTGRGRGTPLSEQPASARRFEDALIGQRNTTLDVRTLSGMGSRAHEFSSYLAYEAYFLPTALAAAHRMEVPEETDAQIVATIRSALGTAWKNRSQCRAKGSSNARSAE